LNKTLLTIIDTDEERNVTAIIIYAVIVGGFIVASCAYFLWSWASYLLTQWSWTSKHSGILSNSLNYLHTYMLIYIIEIIK
jgi:hypothetical protein